MFVLQDLANAGSTKRPTCCVLVQTKPNKGELGSTEQEKLKADFDQVVAEVSELTSTLFWKVKLFFFFLFFSISLNVLVASLFSSNWLVYSVLLSNLFGVMPFLVQSSGAILLYIHTTYPTKQAKSIKKGSKSPFWSNRQFQVRGQCPMCSDLVFRTLPIF